MSIKINENQSAPWCREAVQTTLPAAIRCLHTSTAGNFGLLFGKANLWNEEAGKLKFQFLAWIEEKRNAQGQIVTRKNHFEDIHHRHEAMAARLFQSPACHQALKRIHERQAAVLACIGSMGGFVLQVRGRLASPYVSGLGSGHPTETGMVLDRNTGLPYLPASGVKGVMRLAHGLDLMDGGCRVARGRIDDRGKFREDPDGDQYAVSDEEPTLRKYFGDTDTSKKDAVRGQLVFLDAFPAAVPVLEADIMNPHFAKYYEGKSPPVETDNPIPVKFLSVKAGTEFVFRVFASPLGEGATVDREFGPADEQAVRSMFRRGLEELGLGGKTAVGYGRFGICSSSAAPFSSIPQPSSLYHATRGAVPAVQPQPAVGNLAPAQVAPSITRRPVRQGEMRGGRVQRKNDRWVTLLDDGDYEALIQNQDRVTPGAEGRRALFRVDMASKEGRIKVSWQRWLS